MKTKVLLLSACIGALAATVFACSTTTNTDVADDDAGPTNGNGNDDDDDSGEPNIGDDDGGTTKQDASKDSGSSGSLCQDFCKAIDAANCGETPATCVDECESNPNVPASCNGYYEAFLQCASKAKFTCSDAGAPKLSGCTVEQAALAKCVGSQKDDGGADDGGTNTDGGADGGDAGAACYTPDDAVASTFTGLAPAGQCTNAQVDAIVDGCIGPGATDNACDAALAASAACSACILGPKQTDPSYVPAFILYSDNTLDPNYGACLGVATNKPECAAGDLNQLYCLSDACSTCADQASGTACSGTATGAGGVCESSFSQACFDALSNATTAQKAQCTDDDAIAEFKKVGKVVCVQGAPQ